MLINRGFTMIDLLVSLVVISVLIAIMLPTVTKVRESARKVVCGSNLRQLGMSVSLFSENNQSRLPSSVFMPPQYSNAGSYPSPERMDTLKLTSREFPNRDSDDLWDGLGYLYAEGYVTAPNLYYCPSHAGNYQYDEKAKDWNELKTNEEIIANYLFRGSGPRGSRVLYDIESTSAIVTDSIRSYEDLNHQGGFNILQAGLSVNWFEDDGDFIAQDLLLRTDDNLDISRSVVNAWDRLDGLPSAIDDGSDDNP